MHFFRRNIRKLLILVVGVAVLFFSTAGASALKGQLNDWKLLPQPERLTELYFQDHAKLPGSYTPAVPQQAAFSVHNLEYQDTAYQYRISQLAADGSGRTVLGSGQFSLRQGQSRTTPYSITPVYMGSRSQVEVALTNARTRQTETIHYWMNSTISAQQAALRAQAAAEPTL